MSRPDEGRGARARSASWGGWVDPVGVYRPGTTLVHRTPAGVKLASLSVLGVVLLVLRGPWPGVAVLGLTVGVAVVARLPWRATARGLAPLVASLLVVGAYQAWQRGWPVAVEVTTQVLALVLAATILTATTPADALLDLLARAVRPLRRVGVDPEHVALAVSIMLRAIPALGRTFAEVRDAARARGLERSGRALVIPFAIRTVARARATGEALAARGIGD